MPSTLITNIKELVQTTDALLLRGHQMQSLSTIEDAFLLIEGDSIVDFGQMSMCPDRADHIIDASGRMVFSSWCDSHTHTVFAAYRESEFVDRIHGLSYQEIAAKGGGILNSACKLRAMPQEQLLEDALKRLERIQSQGTGALEIKSGYGLSLEGELKMLRVIKALKEQSNLAIKATFLGAHALPQAYKEDRKAYMDMLLEEALPIIADEGLADYIDVFCEKGFFSVEETQRVLEAGAKYGIKSKIHTNQFTSMGGIEAAIAAGAISVDHLEVMTDEEIAHLADSDVLACVLPGAPFFLNDHYPPARKILEADIPVAVATDFNPGSSPSANMSLAVALSCIKLRMTPEEAINGATINGAAAMEISDTLGSISKGKKANFFITTPMPSIAYLPYSFGENVVDKTFLKGVEV